MSFAKQTEHKWKVKLCYKQNKIIIIDEHNLKKNISWQSFPASIFK